MSADVKHPTLSRFNKETGASEPVMVNRHSIAEPWEYDPDYVDGNKEVTKVVVFGHGVTGEALTTYLEKTNEDLEIAIRDPKKGFEDNILGAQYAFICVPVPIDDDFKQDLTMVMDCLQRVPPETIPVIRSTIVPGTTARLAKQYKRLICHMPEFLTARRSIQDMFDQTEMYFGYNSRYPLHNISQIFPDKNITHSRVEEAEAIKLIHNCFGAMKVTFFNAVKQYCDMNGISYPDIRDGILEVTDFISPEHTMVPGPDGQFGYGGTCFPVNIKAMIGKTKGLPLHEWMRLTHEQNNIFRRNL